MLYALGALSQHEAREFDIHLREVCAVCEAELKQFEQIVGELGSANEPVAPPAYLRDLLAVRIARESSEEAPSPGSVLPFPDKKDAERKPAGTSFSRSLLPWAVAAALLIAFVYSFSVWQADRRSLHSTSEQVQELSDENSQLRAQLSKESARSTEFAQINSVLSSPQWRIIPLAGQPPAPDSSARVYWDLQGKRWVVTADLPPAPEGKVYQLWFVTASVKISAGLINTDKTGHGFTMVQYPDISDLAAAAITLEPVGGSQQPTMPIYALGKAA